jgi:hypothetical protein
MNSYLRQQAEVLRAMSRETVDLGMAERLRKLAADFQEQAELEQHHDGEAARIRSKRSHFDPID